jgi:hypothetical protein
MRNDTNLLMLSGQIISPIIPTPGKELKLEFNMSTVLNKNIYVVPVVLTGDVASDFYDKAGILQLSKGDSLLLTASLGNSDNGDLAIVKVRSAEKVENVSSFTEDFQTVSPFTEVSLS